MPARRRADIDEVVVRQIAVGETIDHHLVDDLIAPVGDVRLEHDLFVETVEVHAAQEEQRQEQGVASHSSSP
jgi:hypothetical protein